MGKEYVWLESSGEFFKGDRLGGIFWRATAEEEAKDDVRWTGDRGEEKEEVLPDLFMESGYFFFPEGYIQDIEMRQFEVVETLEDKFDNLWMATWGLGSGVADMKTLHFDLLPFGPYSPIVDVMAWDEGGMWVGGRRHPGEPGGITWWDMGRGEWVYFEAPYISGLRSDEVTSIAPDTVFVWFGTKEGLARYDKERDAWRVFSVHDNLWDNRVTTVALGEGVLWVGTVWGINRIGLPGMVIEKVRDKGLIHRQIHRLEVDGEDVWAGTDRGIFRYVGERKKWEVVPGYPGMLTDTVTAVSVWEDEVWFGTWDGVEMLDNATGEWHGFPEYHFPLGERINDILADSGAVWVATEGGVWKYKKKEDRWRWFTIEDGLPDNSVRWMLLDGDYIWFGTARGLTRFYWNAPYRID